jgi:hypothetical protein
LQAQEADKVALYATGTWAALENATVNYPTTTGGVVPYNDATIGLVVVGNSPSATIPLEGGMLYTIVKPATAAAAGLDYQFKPRQGF